MFDNRAWRALYLKKTARGIVTTQLFFTHPVETITHHFHIYHNFSFKKGVIKQEQKLQHYCSLSNFLWKSL